MSFQPRNGVLHWLLGLTACGKTPWVVFLPVFLQSDFFLQTFSSPNQLWLAAEFVKFFEVVLNGRALYLLRIPFFCLFCK